MKEEISQFLTDSANLKKKMSEEMTDVIELCVNKVIECYKNGNKILVCGNGGSAADAQHFAAEFVNRFKIDRDPLPAIALTTDTSSLTAIGNDAGYDYVFEKQVKAHGDKEDLLFVITTSDISFEQNGHSTNIAKALVTAKEMNLITIGLVSEKSHDILKYLDYQLIVPHKDTPRIQEAHITLLHIICEIAERELFNK